MIQESVKYKELFNITLVVKNDPYDDDGFDSGTYTVDFQNSIYIIRGDSMIIETVEDDSIIGYLAVTDAPSKFHRFDYYVLFDDKEEILKVEVLHYRENYGGEICSKNWLKQFVGIDTENYSSYSRKIDGISGATISVNSLKHNLLKISNKLKKSSK